MKLSRIVCASVAALAATAALITGSKWNISKRCSKVEDGPDRSADEQKDNSASPAMRE
jgi:hypothetical protein